MGNNLLYSLKYSKKISIKLKKLNTEYSTPYLNFFISKSKINIYFFVFGVRIKLFLYFF